MQNQHPLNENFTFWFSPPKQQKEAQWEDSMKKIGSFQTEFWAIYQHLEKLDKLKIESGFQLFLSKIKPMWEDPLNKNGGRFVLRVKKGYSNYFWENLLLQFIGQQITQVCGIVSNVKENEVISLKQVLISIWVKELQQDQKDYVKNWIRQALDLSEKVDFDFREHPKVNV